jgi:hypothetical protein
MRVRDLDHCIGLLAIDLMSALSDRFWRYFPRRPFGN